MQDGNTSPMQYPLESYINQPPENYPFPEAGLQNQEHGSSINYGGGSVEEKREFLIIARNNLDIFSSILKSEVEPKPIKVRLLPPNLCINGIYSVIWLYSASLVSLENSPCFHCFGYHIHLPVLLLLAELTMLNALAYLSHCLVSWIVLIEILVVLKEVD